MTESFVHAVIAVTAVSVACAMLSVFVVARRWAFLGEGIGHSGIAGAGVVWALAVVFPQLRHESFNFLPYFGVVVASVLAGVGIAVLSRRSLFSGDVSIGIFMVGCVAVGFIGQSLFQERYGMAPVGFETFFFGQTRTLALPYVVSAVVLASAVVLTITMLQKELLAYSLDPELAESSGVRAGLVHFLLFTLISVVIVIGVRLMGTLLMSALLILPAATAGMLSRRLNVVRGLSIGVALLGGWGGLAVTKALPPVPEGPAIALTMFITFLGVMLVRRFRWTR